MGVLDIALKCPYFGNHIVLPAVVKLEGGDKESLHLRSIYKEKYKTAVGLFSYGGCFSPTFNVGGEVTIGRYCSFAENIHYFGANHPIDAAVMSPYFYNRTFGFNVKDVERKSLVIGHDVWCGYGVLITNGCSKIGNGAVIGSGAVVTKDIPPYAIAVGNPARVIRFRFPQNEIDCLEESRWWEETPAELMKHYALIKQPMDFANSVIKNRSLSGT